MFAEAMGKLLQIRPEAAAFTRLGFATTDPAVQRRLGQVLETFVHGYNLAVAGESQRELAIALVCRFDDHHVGFAFEGAGMYFALRDLAAPWSPSRLRAFLDGPGNDFDYIAAVGAGFAMARLPWGLRAWPSLARRLDPLVAWCLPDGYGFHQGIFHPRRYLQGAAPPAALPLWAAQLFDSGLGRSLWWSQGAQPDRIARVVQRFPAQRQPEMWCGLGVAAAYAGGAGEEALLAMLELAGDHRADFISGVPFAARMRQKGRNPSATTDDACELLLGCSTGEAASLVAALAAEVTSDPSIDREIRHRDSYALVRRRLREELRPTAEGERPCRPQAQAQAQAQARRLTTASS